MKLISSLVRADKLDEVKKALDRLHISSLTAIAVRDHSPQSHPTEVWRGHIYNLGFSPKTEIDVVVDDDDVDCVVSAIMSTARTGQAGDGYVSVIPVEHRYSIRTGQRSV